MHRGESVLCSNADQCHGGHSGPVKGGEVSVACTVLRVIVCTSYFTKSHLLDGSLNVFKAKAVV